MRPVCLLMIFLLFTLLYLIIQLKINFLVLLKEPSREFDLLFSPYPCFISLIYLDLYVLGDDALIS